MALCAMWGRLRRELTAESREPFSYSSFELA